MKIFQRTDGETGNEIFESRSSNNEFLGWAWGKVRNTTLEVETIYVVPGSRRQGVGKGLLGTLFNWALGKGAKDVQVDFLPEPGSSVEGARNFYREHGLQEDGTERYKGRLERY